MGQKCVHCGEDCGKNPIMWQDKPFCCNGCKTVYQLLNQNKLFSYYEIQNTPGIKVETEDFGSQYAYLDKDEIKQRLYEFYESDVAKITLYIPSIHCASCVWLLENMNLLNKGIRHSMVNFVKKEVAVTFNDKEVSLREIVELLASIHYIPQITLDRLDSKTESNSANRALLKRIGVAGFAFGNTMLLSWPEYTQSADGLTDQYRLLFGVLNLMFAIPVVFYSGSDYLLSAYKNLRKRMISIDLPVAIGIMAIFLESAFEIVTRMGAGYMDSLTGFVFFLLIGKWYQGKTYKALSFERDYKSYFPVAVTKLTETGEDSILLEHLQEGDRILVRNQELIPADSKLLKGNAFIDYSFVTGESRPIPKRAGDEIFAGGRQIGEALELEVSKKVEQSKLTKLWNQDDKENTISKLDTVTDKVGKHFTIYVVSVAVISAIVWAFIDVHQILNVFTSVLIVACPCALTLTLPFTFGTTMGIFGRKGFYLKKTGVVEKFSKIDTIVFDKTGTITYSDSLNVTWNGEPLNNETNSKLKSLTRQSTHPMSAAIYEQLKPYENIEIQEFRELPARGVVGFFGTDKFKAGSAEFIFGDKPKPEFRGSNVYISVNENPIGFFSVENKYREGLSEIINSLDKEYELHLISGDNASEKDNLLPMFKDAKRLNFNQSPTDKLEYIKNLKAQGKHVLMIGDGLNDAGALSEAHAGISIADDIYHFSPACDAILEAGKFSALQRYIRFTKTAIRVVKISFAISFVYNIIGIYFGVTGQLEPIIAAILMPASSVSVVGFVTLTTRILAKTKKL